MLKSALKIFKEVAKRYAKPIWTQYDIEDLSVKRAVDEIVPTLEELLEKL